MSTDKPSPVNRFKTPLKLNCLLFFAQLISVLSQAGPKGILPVTHHVFGRMHCDLCCVGLECHFLSEVNTHPAGPQAGNSQSLPNHYFFFLPVTSTLFHPSHYSHFLFFKVWDLIAPSPTPFGSQKVPRPSVCYLQTSAVPKPRQGRGASQWGKNSFSPGTEEDKVSCLFSPSCLSLPHSFLRLASD